MFGSNRLALAFLGVACVAAAGGGSYLATRHGVAERAVPVASADASEPTGTMVPESAAPPATPPIAAVQPMAGVAAATGAPRNPARQSAAARPAQAVRQAPQAPLLSRVDDGRALDRSIPTPTIPPATAAAPTDVLPSSPTEDARLIDYPTAPDQSTRVFQELVVSADSVIGLQTEGLVSSERARVEDPVEARVVRDVRVGGEVAIPAGARALGTVVVVDRGGKVRQAARLGIRFHTLLMPDGTRLPVTTETIFRMSEAPSNSSAAKIGGGAVAGAILGAIIGGGKGAAIGATTGAGAGSAAVMTGDRSAATFPSGSEVTARILSPVTVTIERE